MMEFEGKTKDFYDKCLSDLEKRSNYSQTWLPVLEQYVFKMSKAWETAEEIKKESLEVDHTNKSDHTNKASSPKWRMYLELTKAAAALAKDLQLNPATAPAGLKMKTKGFDLSGKNMKVA